MTPNKNCLALAIDPTHPADQSVALRYADALCVDGLTRSALVAASLREGIRLLDIGGWRGVRLFLVDESTRMASGTYKSLDGCVTTAVCRSLGNERIVFSSGANVGIALTMYGAQLGLETYFFCPTSTLYKLDGALLDRPTAHLIAVDGSDQRVKAAAQAFSEATRFPMMPTAAWRLRSAACRGLFLAEKIRDSSTQFNWFAQSICAGYGPIGIYNVFRDLIASGTITKTAAPRFLGIQQAELAPIANAWAAGREQLPPQQNTVDQPRNPLIEPSLYNAHPAATYPELRSLLGEFGGGVRTVNTTDFHRLENEFIGLLQNVGVIPTQITRSGITQHLERAGLMAGVGTLRAIEDGFVRPGESVLCSFTGGAGPAPSRAAMPEFDIAADQTLEPQIQKYAEHHAILSR